MLQVEALEIMKTGANIFLTGVPGAGKTYVVNKYVEWLRDKGIYPAITASTGIASTHIGGTTIHSFSGIGIEKDLNEYKIEKIMEREKLVKKIIPSIKKIMESVVDLKLSKGVVCVAEASEGENWGTMAKIV